MKLLAIVAITLTSTVCWAQGLAYKGVPLGATKEELIEKFPALECSKVPASSAVLGEEKCSAKVGAPFDQTRPLYTYAEQPVQSTWFGVINGRVEQFAMTMDPDRYEAVKGAVIEAYGPGKETSTQRQTMGGATFRSRTYTVQRQGGELAVMEHAGRIDQGGIDARTSAFTTYVDRVLKGDPKRGSKDL